MWVSSIFRLAPRIRREGRSLIASTSFLGFLCSLTLLQRQVRIDTEHEEVVLRSRWFWFVVRERRIPFAEVEALSYHYSDWNPLTSLGMTGNPLDCYTVSLHLNGRRRQPVHLFRFLGAGQFTNRSGMPDWMYWKEFRHDIIGTQEGESRAWVDALQSLLDVPLKT